MEPPEQSTEAGEGGHLDQAHFYDENALYTIAEAHINLYKIVTRQPRPSHMEGTQMIRYQCESVAHVSEVYAGNLCDTHHRLWNTVVDQKETATLATVLSLRLSEINLRAKFDLDFLRMRDKFGVSLAENYALAFVLWRRFRGLGDVLLGSELSLDDDALVQTRTDTLVMLHKARSLFYRLSTLIIATQMVPMLAKNQVRRDRLFRLCFDKPGHFQIIKNEGGEAVVRDFTIVDSRYFLQLWDLVVKHQAFLQVEPLVQSYFSCRACGYGAARRLEADSGLRFCSRLCQFDYHNHTSFLRSDSTLFAAGPVF